MKAKILNSAKEEIKLLSGPIRMRLIDDICQLARGWGQWLPSRRLRRRLFVCGSYRQLRELRLYSTKLFFYVPSGEAERCIYVVGVFTRDSPPIKNVEAMMWRRVKRARMRDGISR